MGRPALKVLPVPRERKEQSEPPARLARAWRALLANVVLLSGFTVMISLSAVALVPSPAFRSTSLGIVLAVVFVLAAALTLLPAILAKLGARIDRLPIRRSGTEAQQARRFTAWGERLWRRPEVWASQPSRRLRSASHPGCRLAETPSPQQERKRA